MGEHNLEKNMGEKVRKKYKLLALMLTMAMVFCLAPTLAFATDNGLLIERVEGSNRYITSAETALKSSANLNTDTVIIARGDNAGGLADGLTASYLAGLKDAPILLTAVDSLPGAVKETISQLGATKAIILGGPAAVSTGVENTLIADGLTVERIYGDNRYETAAMIAAKGGAVDEAIVVGGTAKVDALLAGPSAFNNHCPVLLVDENNVNDAREVIEKLGIKKINVVGGTGVVSDSVFNQLSDKVAEIARYGGQNRIETSLAVAKNLFTDPVGLSIVGYSGEPDAVGAAAFGNPIFYVQGNDVSYLQGLATTKTRFSIFGGPGVVSCETEHALAKLLFSIFQREGNIEPIIVPNGTSAANAIAQLPVNIAWEAPAGYNAVSGGPYIFQGDITPATVPELKTTAVMAADTSGAAETMVLVEKLKVESVSSSINPIAVPNGTAATTAIAKLPTTMKATLNDESASAVTLNVAWTAPEGYKASTAGSYTFTGKLTGGVGTDFIIPSSLATVTATIRVEQPISTPTPSRGSTIVQTANRYLGVPYVYGGMSPSGFDCSGLVKYVYAQNGITLPRVACDQANAGTKIWNKSQLQQGDIVCFCGNGGSYVSHVGIYIGNDQFIHANSPKVIISSLSGSWYKDKYSHGVHM